MTHNLHFPFLDPHRAGIDYSSFIRFFQSHPFGSNEEVTATFNLLHLHDRCNIYERLVTMPTVNKGLIAAAVQCIHVGRGNACAEQFLSALQEQGVINEFSLLSLKNKLDEWPYLAQKSVRPVRKVCRSTYFLDLQLMKLKSPVRTAEGRIFFEVALAFLTQSVQ